MIQLVKAVKVLAEARVDFVLIGGLALRSHGSAYLTQDVDVCYSRETENLKRIAAALAPFDPRPRGMSDDLPFVWDWTTLQHGTNFTFKTSLCDIDFLGEVAGVGDFREVLNNSEVADLEGVPIRVLTIDGLIRAKTAAGRSKDQAGLEELYALKEAFSDIRE